MQTGSKVRLDVAWSGIMLEREDEWLGAKGGFWEIVTFAHVYDEMTLPRRIRALSGAR